MFFLIHTYQKHPSQVNAASKPLVQLEEDGRGLPAEGGRWSSHSVMDDVFATATHDVMCGWLMLRRTESPASKHRPGSNALLRIARDDSTVCKRRSPESFA